MINTYCKRRSSIQSRRWRIGQPSSHSSGPLIDFSKPELWNGRTPQIVDEFLVKLENFSLNICRTCSRFQTFIDVQENVDIVRLTKKGQSITLWTSQRHGSRNGMLRFKDYFTNWRRSPISSKVLRNWSRCLST